MSLILNWKEMACILALVLTLNLADWQNSLLKIFAAIVFLLVNALVFGNWLDLKNSSAYKIAIGLLFVFSLAGIGGAISFYLYQLNYFSYLGTLGLITLVSIYLSVKKPLILEFPDKLKLQPDFKISILTVCYLLLIFFFCYLVAGAATAQSLRSPWEVVPSEAFVIYLIATFCLFQISLAKFKFSILLICLHFFISFSLAAIIYQVGFDYDPFIHRANENLILQSGTLLPKPWYYIGQYSLVLFLHWLTSLSVELLDKLLVPVLAALFLPLTIYFAFKDNFHLNLRVLLISILSLLILPFGIFISTTPQALANLLLLITLLLTIYFLNRVRLNLWPLLVLGIFALAVHPLAGIPCLFFIGLVLVYHHFQKKFPLPKFLHLSIFWETAVLSAFALPLAFLINSQTLSQLKIKLVEGWLQNLGQFFSENGWKIFYQPFVSLPDYIYTIGQNSGLVFLALAILGLVLVVKHKQFNNFFIYPLSSLILLFDYLFLVLGVSFLTLISYEQRNYPNRILEMSLYFLLPFVILSLYKIWQKIFKQKRLIVFLSLIMLSSLLTASLYFSYPRVDKISEDHGYSTSATDLKTVNILEKLNQTEPYLVLASQPVSAAAIKELGFRHYYRDYFFYPVPTGGTLYQLYEDLAYAKRPTPEIIKDVYDLTGVAKIYFVINDYWFNAKDVILEHKKTASHWLSIDNKNFIFEYRADQPFVEQLSSAN